MKNLFYIIFLIAIGTSVKAEVNLLTGAYLYKIQIGHQQLNYDSRQNSLGEFGFGWKVSTSKPLKNCRFSLKDGLLVLLSCHKLNANPSIWHFKYDDSKNLQTIVLNGNLLESIEYNPEDTVKNLRTEKCSYKFSYKNVSRRRLQATESISQCQGTAISREVTLFSLIQGKNLVYTPTYVKKIGGSIALQNRP